MKKLLLSILFYQIFPCQAVVIRWDGEAGDGQWASSLNWDLDRIPGPEDDVILDHAYTATGYSVFLPGGSQSVQIHSFVIAPSEGRIIICELPSSNTASAALLITGDGESFVLHDGAVFRNASGATGGTPVSVTGSAFFRIDNGARYIHQTQRGHTDYLVSRLSQAPGTENGVFEFDVPGDASYTVSASNRVYGTLVFSGTGSTGIKNYTASGTNPVRVRGDLQVGSGVRFSYGANTDTISVEGECRIMQDAVLNLSNGGNSAVLMLNGDFINEGTLTETGSSMGTTLLLKSSSRQRVSGGGILGQIEIVIDNPAGIELMSPFAIPHQLVFIKGKVFGSTDHPVVFGTAATCEGASASAFIEGAAVKQGGTAFQFPIGKGEIFAPISIGGEGAEADEFLAEYKRSNPGSTPGLGNIYEAPIHHISYVEYWNLFALNGGGPRTITLSVSPYSFAYSLQDLVVASAVSGRWVSKGGTGYQSDPMPGPYVAGSFSTEGKVSDFGSFSLGSITAEQQNPLPIPFVFFEGFRRNGQVQLKWRTGICPSSSLKFELQRSGPERQFLTTAVIAGTDSVCDYSFTDRSAGDAELFYRIKCSGREEVGMEQVFLSEIISFKAGQEKLPGLRAPVLVTDELPVSLSPALNGHIELLLIAVNGTGVISFKKKIPENEQPLLLSLSGMPAGMYCLVGITREGKTNTIRFLKTK